MLKKFGIALAFVGALMFAGNVCVSSVRAEEKKDASKTKGEHKKGEAKKKADKEKEHKK